MHKIIFIGGGARSGKSAFALKLARQLGSRRAFLATAHAGDDEMRIRIERHRRERGSDFATLEEPLALAAVLGRPSEFDVVVVDCLTLWLSNLMLEDRGEADILQRVDELIAVLQRRQRHVIVVSNEVGMGVVPESPLGRAFRDWLGLTHQRLGAAADEVYFAVLGTVLRIKPTLELM